MYNKLKICMMGIGLIMLGISGNYNVIAMEQNQNQMRQNQMGQNQMEQNEDDLINKINNITITSEQERLMNKISKINDNITLNNILDDLRKKYYSNIDTLLRKIRNYETELGTIVDVILAHFANLFQCYNNSKNFHINIYEILKRIFFVRNNNIQMDNDRHEAFILPPCDEIIQTINDCIDKNSVQ